VLNHHSASNTEQFLKFFLNFAMFLLFAN